ncbi:MAG: SRPBCC family protein [Polyangiaceae bacterium]|nr:SRPBCC family protein [Polyangiaceae bacterium]
MKKWIIRVVVGFFLLIALFFGVLYVVSGGAKGKGYHEAKIEINKPAAAVFPWLTEPAKQKQWIFGLAEVKPLTEGDLRVGARSQETMVIGEEQTVMVSEVIELDPGKRMVVKITSPGFDGQIRYVLDEAGASSTLRYIGDFQYKPFMLRLLEPLVTPSAQRKLEGDLMKLKAEVEASQSADG